MRLLADICKSPGFWEVDPKRTKVLPFPGKFPTRWRITFTKGYGPKPYCDVITRPNSLIVNSILRRAKEPGFITLWEFDRGGTFRYLQRGCPRKDFMVNKIAQPIGAFYYPWHRWASGFFDPWLMPMFHKQMKLGKRIFFIYSPYERMFNGANDSVVEGLPKVVAENKSVEVIDLGKLPRLPEAIRIQMRCADCGAHYSKLEKYRGLIIRCDNCGYAQRCV